MVAAPALFAAVVELVRLGADGPTVDAPHASAFGVLALLAGRGAHGLLALLPMLVGAAYGASSTRQASSSGRLRRYVGRAVIGLLAAVVALLAVGVALPATTARIPGGVAELTTFTAGEHRLGLMIRGIDRTKPVLLFVPGAPGAAERGAVRRHLAELERHFVVATLDRRGGGASYAALEPTATVSLRDEVATTLAATDYLRQRFHADKIYLLAHSGGTVPAVLAAQQSPRLFRAYIGVGQAVETGAADRVQYADTLAWARRHHDAALVKTLEAAGPPPYPSVYGYEPMLLAEPTVYAQPATQGGVMDSLAAPEYTLLDKLHVFAGLVDAYSVYYPRMRDVDLRAEVTRLAIPAYFVDGAEEVPIRASLLREWYAGLQAPHKEHLVLPGTGHRSMYERPHEFVETLERVLTDTAPYGSGSGGGTTSR